MKSNRCKIKGRKDLPLLHPAAAFFALLAPVCFFIHHSRRDGAATMTKASPVSCVHGASRVVIVLRPRGTGKLSKRFLVLNHMLEK